MRKLTHADIKDLREYERERAEFRTEIIAMKKRRRIALGDIMTLAFENGATMRFQIQEMARAERIIRDDRIAHELETYNELIPETGELSATLFIEIDDPEALQYWLPRLTKIQDFVSFDIAGEKVPASETNAERLTREEEITSTVHYLKFAFSERQRRAFEDDTEIAILVDHPEYDARTVLSDEQRSELAGDFAA